MRYPNKYLFFLSPSLFRFSFEYINIWRERIRREVEVELNHRYAEKKKEFEQRMEEDTNIILQKQDELLEERRAAIAKEEQEQLARIQQIRQSHELSYQLKLKERMVDYLRRMGSMKMAT